VADGCIAPGRGDVLSRRTACIPKKQPSTCEPRHRHSRHSPSPKPPRLWMRRRGCQGEVIQARGSARATRWDFHARHPCHRHCRHPCHQNGLLQPSCCRCPTRTLSWHACRFFNQAGLEQSDPAELVLPLSRALNGVSDSDLSETGIPFRPPHCPDPPLTLFVFAGPCGHLSSAHRYAMFVASKYFELCHATPCVPAHNEQTGRLFNVKLAMADAQASDSSHPRSLAPLQLK